MSAAAAAAAPNQTSPNKKRFHCEDAELEPSIQGLRFFAMKNSKGSFVIPSTKNFIDEFQIKKIKCDEGATCSVLPIANCNMLQHIIEKYAAQGHVLSLKELRSIAGTTLGLTVAHPLNHKIFAFRIGLDVYPTVLPAGAPNEAGLARSLDGAFIATEEKDEEAISTSNMNWYAPQFLCSGINFFLCSQDVEYLLQNLSLQAPFKKSNTFGLLKEYDHYVARRNSALLGNDFLGLSTCSLTYDRVRYWVDSDVHRLELCSWRNLSVLSTAIINMGYLKKGSVDFEVLDSIEPNDVHGFVDDEQIDPYDDDIEV